MSRKDWAVVVLVVSALIVGVVWAAFKDEGQRTLRNKANTERCIKMCEPRSGMSHWTTIKVGWSSYQRLCVCWDGTEIRLP